MKYVSSSITEAALKIQHFLSFYEVLWADQMLIHGPRLLYKTQVKCLNAEQCFHLCHQRTQSACMVIKVWSEA